MKFTVRMFASTQDGHQFIHKTVDIPNDVWGQLMSWAVENRGQLLNIQGCNSEQDEAALWGPVYDSYGELTRSLPLALSQDNDFQAAIAHFFNLAIDNPVMLPVVGQLGKVAEPMVRA